MGMYSVKGDKKQNNGWGVTGISVSASKILAIPHGTCTIMKFFPSQLVVSSASSHDVSMHDVVQLSGGDGTTGSSVINESENNTVNVHMSDFDDKGMRKSQKDQEQAASDSLLDQATGDETLCLSRKESESCLEISEVGPSNKFPSEETALLQVSPVKKPIKESKGTTSILRFLKRSEPSSFRSEHKQNSILQENCMASSSEKNTERRESWNYNVDEIDPTIIDELPPDIQEELRGWLRPMKQPHSSKRSCITSYFSPTKGTG